VITAVIVQARVGSTRLPGKVLKPLAGHTVLEEVLHRCRAIPGADQVVCAIPDLAEDDILIPIAEKAGATVVRGSANDVLARYRLAAEHVGADIIMRVTSDCPLIDPGLCGEVLKLRAQRQADYACNNMPPSFPHGLDCEAFTFEALMRADRATSKADDREHVTPWLRKAHEIKRVSLQGPGGELAEQRWTLDYPEDYDFLFRLFALLPPPPAIPSWTEVAAMLDARPDIRAINARKRNIKA
jgi:glutamate-1-semialdehyde 2,1-aminomutase/spore coat polysaccharide biosynthesis protein SpsF